MFYSIINRFLLLIKLIVSAFKYKRMIPIYQMVDSKKILSGKVALITGGSGGIGMAIAKRFLESGCKVIICGTNEEKLRNCSKELGGANFLVVNMLETNTFKSLFEKAFNIHGKIDIYVACHGVHSTRKGLDWHNVTEEEYDDIMNINLKGTYFACQAMGNIFVKNKIKGHILIVSSECALLPSWSPYRISKRGIQGLTEGLAQRMLEHGIVVNAIGPGPTATTMQPSLIRGSVYCDNEIERLVMPEEIAEYALLMVSELGNTIVGDTLYMSGGCGIISKK